jgi:hypothetical protein
MPDSLTDHFLLWHSPSARRGGEKFPSIDISVVDPSANRRITRVADVIQERGP